MPGHVFSDLVGPGACAVRAFLPGAKISAQGGLTAQPLAALPPYGCGVPLAGASARACKSKGWRPPPAAGTQKERHDVMVKLCVRIAQFYGTDATRPLLKISKRKSAWGQRECTTPKTLDKYDCLKQHQGLYVYERLEADHPGSI